MKDTDRPRALADCAELINRHGPDSPEVLRFIEERKDDPEFVELAELSRQLSKALKGTP